LRQAARARDAAGEAQNQSGSAFAQACRRGGGVIELTTFDARDVLRALAAGHPDALEMVGAISQWLRGATKAEKVGRPIKCVGCDAELRPFASGGHEPAAFLLARPFAVNSGEAALCAICSACAADEGLNARLLDRVRANGGRVLDSGRG
jgi:hypothetical protein